MKLFNKRKTRTIFLNTIAEFAASVIFSLLFFIFISRYISEDFGFDFITLSFAIGLSYFVSVYIPFYTYRIHIIPFITVLRALQKKNFSLIIYKVPAQILGALAGVGLFTAVNSFTTEVNVNIVNKTSIDNIYFLSLLNFLLTAVLCYGFYVIRIIFRKRSINGTIFLGLLITILFAFSGGIQGLTFLNPFGYLAVEVFRLAFNPIAVLDFILLHILSPLLATLLSYYFINIRFGKESAPFFRAGRLKRS
ncbi:MAG: hypothetical protein R3277_01380 [Brumimicrobium sp.]|nr:hypothetical protein [Brumimicrobium sp.]